MRTDTILVGGFRVRIDHQFDFLRRVSPEFRVENEECDLRIEVTEQDLLKEKEALTGRRYYDEALEALAVQRKIAEWLPTMGAVMFHGVVMAVNGCGYLFTARSGVGKTTHARLWLKNVPGSSIVNGDKPILRLQNEVVLACGSPWMGKENYGENVNVPLEAICLLKRGQVNSIKPMSFTEALPVLLQQTYRPQDGSTMIATLDLIRNISSRIQLYTLTCNQQDEAALIAWNGMCSDKTGKLK